jgi:hypothetical protein
MRDQFSNSHLSIFDPGDPMCRSQSVLKRMRNKKYLKDKNIFLQLFLSSRATNANYYCCYCIDLFIRHFKYNLIFNENVSWVYNFFWWIENIERKILYFWKGTYNLSTSGFKPCILPTIVPLLLFFTQPRIPAFKQLSRQNFVKPTPNYNFN